jgi:hypothetical protein
MVTVVIDVADGTLVKPEDGVEAFPFVTLFEINAALDLNPGHRCEKPTAACLAVAQSLTYAFC